MLIWRCLSLSGASQSLHVIVFLCCIFYSEVRRCIIDTAGQPEVVIMVPLHWVPKLWQRSASSVMASNSTHGQ